MLGTLAALQGAADRCALWKTLSDVQRGVFLTHTDLLGNRSCMRNDDIQSGALDANANCPDKTNPCQCPAGSPMALDHVVKLWAIQGSDPGCACAEGPNGYKCCNGGEDWHRVFFTADDSLILYLREVSDGLPAWGLSSDPGGPHAPFTFSSETLRGQPTGQAHFFRNDSQAVALQRPGVMGVLEPHLVELDNDYNLQHNSNPEGCYGLAGHLCSYGRVHFKNVWSETGNQAATTFAENGEPSAIDALAGDEVWSPRCGPAISSVTGQGGGQVGRGSVLVVRGTGFAGCPDGRRCGNSVVLRTRADSAIVDDASPFNLAQASGELRVQVPAEIAAGEAWLYVQVGGVLSDPAPLTLAR